MFLSTITLEEAQARLPELIGALSRGEELAVARDGKVVARIVGERTGPRRRPGPGLGKGMITIVAEDEEHLDAFYESMPH
jgi:antitoxin (DNA-binding transcriptional repressor) of toxin-antitoxin stability system